MAERLENVHLAQPTVGLFVGVSNYGERSRLWSTPAHTISAAMFREPFYLTARPIGDQDDLFLVADLRLAPNTALASSTEYALRQIPGLFGLDRQFSDFWKDNLNDDGTLNYIGGGEPVTRKKILDSLTGTLARAEQVAQKSGAVVLVFYISAHGWIGSDGKPYVLPSDADYNDKKTWIGQEELFESIAQFLNRSKSDKIRRRAIVVFDTCQTARDDALEKNANTVFIPSFMPTINAHIIETTSLGHYAWHWTADTEITGNVEITSEKRWGFPLPPPKAERGPIERKLSSNMSVTPLASNCAISDFFAEVERPRQPLREPLEEDEILEQLFGRNDTRLNVLTWLLDTSLMLSDATRNIREVKESGDIQEMQIFSMPDAEVYDLFVYTKPKEEPKGANK